MAALPATSQLRIIKKVLDNIIEHPNNTKYRSMNVTRLNKKFGYTTAYFKWLHNAGFVHSDDTKHKLTFNSNNLNHLRFIHSKLISLLNMNHIIKDDAS